MTELTQDLSLAQAHSLIDSYAFDLYGDDAEQLLQSWLNKYHASWIRLATIEALYLGRYKAISIQHILNVWSRMGSPNPHFSYEFERLICRKLPKHLSDLSDFTSNAAKTLIRHSDRDSVEPKIKNKTIAKPKIKNETIAKPNLQSVEPNETLNIDKSFQQPKQSERNIPIISALRGFPCQTNWSEFTVGQTTIHQFIPIPDVSSFFNKLKTFGEERLEH